jgi:hypothetical protein
LTALEAAVEAALLDGLVAGVTDEARLGVLPDAETEAEADDGEPDDEATREAGLADDALADEVTPDGALDDPDETLADDDGALVDCLVVADFDALLPDDEA